MRIQTIIILLLTSFSLTGQGIMLAGGAVVEEGEIRIDEISNLALWLDASDMNGDFVTDNLSSPASTWVNKGNLGLGNYTKNASPTMSTINGYQSIYFDSAFEYYQSPNNSEYNFVHDGTGKATLFVVLRPNNTGATLNFVIGNASASGERGFYLNMDNGERIDISIRRGQTGTNVAELQGDIALTTTNLNIFKAEFDTGNTTVNDRLESYVNGVQNNNTIYSDADAATGNATYPVYISKRGNTSSKDDYRGYISEIIIFKKELTSQEVSIVENYLSNKYGL